jgi:hypothetical protein
LPDGEVRGQSALGLLSDARSELTSSISTANVDLPEKMASYAPIRVAIRSTGEILYRIQSKSIEFEDELERNRRQPAYTAFAAGTKHPS